MTRKDLILEIQFPILILISDLDSDFQFPISILISNFQFQIPISDFGFQILDLNFALYWAVRNNYTF